MKKKILPNLIKKLKKLDDSIQIIIVDDGSDDGSENIINNDLPFTIVKNKINRGKGASIIKALNYIKNKYTILIDGDLEIDVEDIPVYINIFENSNADVISGNRWGESNKNNFNINRLGNFLINGLFNALFFSNVKDVLCCLKILNSDLLKSLNLNSQSFSVEVEIMGKLFQRKKIVKEININYVRRSIQEGKKIKVTDSFDIIKKIFLLKKNQ
tara:strand:+ start:847 stop:1488 length:642 start_codon:yes stop_codon:yes gene_type:complete